MGIPGAALQAKVAICGVGKPDPADAWAMDRQGKADFPGLGSDSGCCGFSAQGIAKPEAGSQISLKALKGVLENRAPQSGRFTEGE